MSITHGTVVAPSVNGLGEREPALQSQSGPPGRFATGLPRREPRFAKAVKQVSCEPVQPSAEDWRNQEPDVIRQYYAQTSEDFFYIVDEYRDQANEAGELYWSSLLSHRRWRFWTIIATGFLAAINVGAASNIPDISLWGTISPSKLLTMVAAFCAAGLTVLGNVENFLNRPGQAAEFREVRESLLNRYREYRFKWLYYVEAYGKTSKACMNAGRLYSELVYSDQELRQKIKQVTDAKESSRGKPSTSGQR